jgi:hypothetical protein
MTFSDQTLECADCRRSFTWTAGEQQFYAERQFSAPKRCAGCREARRLERQELSARQQSA